MPRRGRQRTRVDGPFRMVGYLRVSTDKQADSGAGIETQRCSIERECERRGWILAEVVTDNGHSGKSLDRPGLNEARSALAAGGYDGLVCAKLDRLSRSVKDFCELVEEARRQGWAMSVLDCQVDTSTPVGEMVANVLASFAQFERRMISQRTKDALAVKRAQGIRLGRPPTASSRAEEIVAEMAAKGATMEATAARLTAEGLPAPRGGARWYPSTVYRMALRLGVRKP
ncbi:MAG: recombinase family protein [Armatimonadetes bacterium]|nr:recombinase family protein [Armatimonadota bacterium]